LCSRNPATYKWFGFSISEKSPGGEMLEEPELIELIPEEEPEEVPSNVKLRKRLVLQIVTVIVLKVATGIAIRNFSKTVREIDILYPESFERIRWTDMRQ
jgi:hypothetical protein